MFYVPWEGNGEKLDSLCNVLNHNTLKVGSIHVDGYGRDVNIVKVRCNRLKTELINRCGLSEDNFVTTNNIGKYNGMKYVVVVTVIDSEKVENQAEAENQHRESTSEQTEISKQETAPAEQNDQSTTSEQTAKVAEEVAKLNAKQAEAAAKQAEEAAKVAEEVAEANAKDAAKRAKTEHGKKSSMEAAGRWSVGANVGMPFFWGDMLTIASDKTYGGIAAGIQGSYRIYSWLATSLSVDYAYGKLGPRGYAKDFLLAQDGMTWYVPQSEAMRKYEELNSKVQLVNVGLSLDFNVNRIFGEQAAKNRFTAWVSPTVYGQFFFSDIRLKENGELYSDGTTSPAAISLGLGGSASLATKYANL